MESVSGESLYLFRHALLREAAYELYPPSVRAKLHRLVVEIATFLFEDSQLSPLAAELADHARAAWQGTDDESLQRIEAGFCNRAASHARAMYQNSDAVSFLTRIADLPALTDAERVKPLADASYAAYLSGDIETTERLAKRADALRPTGIELAGLRNTQAAVCYLRSDIDEAIRLAEEARDGFRSTKDERGCARAMNILAVCYTQTGEYGLARSTYQEAAAIFREIGDRRGEGGCATNLALLLEQTGERDESERLYNQALEIDRECGDLRGEGIDLVNYGLLLTHSGRADEASAILEKALELCTQVGDRYFENLARLNLAVAYSRLNQEQTALQLLAQSVLDARDIGSLHNEAVSHSSAGPILIELGRLDEAQTELELALEQFQSTRNTRLQASTWLELAKLHGIRNDNPEADLALRNSIKLYAVHGDHATLAEVHGLLAELLMKDGRLTDAANEIETAVQLARKLADGGVLAGELQEVANDIKRAEQA
ncbi:MAG: tetratricopeptide repeat protein [Planctomycetes bacterium]|nr:tetratricopeptide repeat protein [Planctomycetota bacterium]MCA8937265.1 tetratricopeptide repeat protein [Planctomycetota bacterium]